MSADTGCAARARADKYITTLAADPSVDRATLLVCVAVTLARAEVMTSAVSGWLAARGLAHMTEEVADALWYRWLTSPGGLAGLDRDCLADPEVSVCAAARMYAYRSLPGEVTRQLEGGRTVPLGATQVAEGSSPPSGPDLVGLLESLGLDAVHDESKDLKTLKGQVTRRSGEHKRAALARVLGAGWDLPPLVVPTDPAERSQALELVLTRPRLVADSLEAFSQRLVGREPDVSAPEVLVALWDATTARERERAAAAPDMVLATWAEAALAPARRPTRAVERGVRRRVVAAVGAGLADELLESFWAAHVVALTSQDRRTSQADRNQRERAATVASSRLPALASRVAALPGAPLGASGGDVVERLREIWQEAERR